MKMKKLFLNLEVIDGYPLVSMESIWAEVTEEGYLKVNNIPFYSKEISLGDIVSGIQTEEYWISNEVAKIIEPYLCEKLDTNNYDYFLSCEEDNI